MSSMTTISKPADYRLVQPASLYTRENGHHRQHTISIISDISISMVVSTEGLAMSDHSGPNQFSTSCTDQEYLVLRAREAMGKGDTWEAKTWMLTARAIFPENFSIQFEAYTSEKEGRHVRESAKCLQSLFDKFPEEPNLVKELEVIMEVLRNVTNDQEVMENDKKFYVDMFDEISESGQKRMIIFAAESAKESLEHCKLMLILMMKFPGEIPTYGEKLIETINNVEKHELGSSAPPLNQFRKMLVVDILPTVMASGKLKISSKLLLKNLYKAQEFVVAFVNKTSPVNFEIKNPWRLLYNILGGVGQCLGWSGMPSLPPNTTTIPVQEYLSHLSTLGRASIAAPADSRLAQQLFHILSCVLLHTLSQYTSLSQVHNSVMVEAWVTHDTQGTDREKHKRRKTQDDPSSSLPVLSFMSNTSLDNSTSTCPLITSFQQVVSAWSLVTSISSLDSQFQGLVAQLTQTVGNLDMISSFKIDYKLHAGQLREALQDARLVMSENNTTNTKTVWAVLKLATVQYCLGDQRSTAQSLVECVGQLDSLGECKEGTEMEVERLTIPTSRQRHCRFIPLTRSAVLSYCCKLLTCLLQERALQPGVQGDMAMGHTITIMQYNWPDNRELFYHLLNRVRGREGFSYPLFCQYVINIEILEEVMFLANEQGGGLVMDIVPGGSGGTSGGSGRVGTRGANRGEKEEFRNAMRKQAARSHESIDRIIVEFLTNHIDLILQTLA